MAKPPATPAELPDPEAELLDNPLENAKVALQNVTQAGRQIAKQLAALPAGLDEAFAQLSESLEAVEARCARESADVDRRRGELTRMRQSVKREVCQMLYDEWRPDFEELSRVFAVLGHPLRLQLLAYFEDAATDATLTDLAKYAKTHAGPLQHHIKALMIQDILRVTRVHGTNYYSLTDSLQTRAAFHYLWLTKEMQDVYARQLERGRQEMAAHYAELVKEEEEEEAQE